MNKLTKSIITIVLVINYIIFFTILKKTEFDDTVIMKVYNNNGMNYSERVDIDSIKVVLATKVKYKNKIINADSILITK